MYKYGKALIVLSAAMICFTLGYYQKQTSFSQVPPQVGQFIYCEKSLSSNKDVLNVYLTESSMAEPLLERLCSNPIVRRQFGNVQLTVGQNDYDTFRYINHGVSDLALVKSSVVEAFGANGIYGYETLAMHNNYSAYFIALREKPELTREYLIGKRLGILDYPSSRSGHTAPKTVMQSLGLSENNVTLLYYSSHEELRRALSAGEVDVIASYWSKADEEQLSKNYITALVNNVSGMRWYLRMQTRNTDLRCALQQIIESATAQSDKTYYQRIQILDRCNEEG